jgi:hypothetical protein
MRRGKARADDPWGTIKGADPWSGDRPISRVLEIFLYGGLSPWETIYVNPGLEGAACPPPTPTCPDERARAFRQWGTFRCATEAFWREVSPPGLGGMPTTEFFEGVHFGPATYPLQVSDIYPSTRVLVTSHDLKPHEAAIPYSLTGTRLGRPTFAGTGAWVMRHFATQSPDPAAYVLVPERIRPADNVLSATATGLIGSAYKPLTIDVPCEGPQLSVVERPDTPGEDALLRHYRKRYRERLIWPRMTEPVRSDAFADYEAATNHFLNHKNIAAALRGFVPDPSVTRPPATGCIFTDTALRCSTTPTSVLHALRFAAYLLRRPATRYVCVVDTGTEETSEAGYDTHSDNARVTFRNLWETLSALKDLVSAASGPAIPGDTLIVLSTEFGRTPHNEGLSGRNHYPEAYANVIIPPRTATRQPAGKRIVGRIDADGLPFRPPSSPVASLSPTDLRAAMLVALGIDPFTDGNFGSGGLTQGIGGEGDEIARSRLVKEVLGYAI